MFKFKSESDYLIFTDKLERMNANYDPEVLMPVQNFGGNTYHTKIRGGRVHSTREAFVYATALFDSGKPEYIDRAKQIVRKVANLQDKNPDSDTYGIWSWYYEEPLEEMDNPDRNWADFCGKELLQLCLHHRELLEDDLFRLIKDSVRHACISIIRRNVSMGYTNIAIMGTYVTLTAGELFGWEDVLEYAKDRARRFHSHVMHTGCFSEYNSPTYTTVAIEDIAKLLRDVKDPDSLRMFRELYDIAWRQTSLHFHAPTGEWAGPHSRCYSNLLRNEHRAFLQYSLDDEVALFSDHDMYVRSLPVTIFRNDPKCPPEYRKYFKEFAGEIELREAQSVDERGAGRDYAYTYMTEKYTIGTFPSGNFWNQRRGQIAYFGTPDNPVAYQVKFLHDMYDYCSAILHNTHKKNTVLSAVNFTTNGGDTHVNLDMVKNGTIKARDLRLRFEFTAKNDTSVIEIPDTFANPLKFTICGVKCTLAVPYAKFGDEPVCFEVTQKANSYYIDVIFCAGGERTVDFNAIDEAVCGYALFIAGEPCEIDCRIEDGKLLMTAGDLSVSALVKPSTSREIYAG